MARKPNYDFERREREKAKAAKTAERVKAKEKAGSQTGPTLDSPSGKPDLIPRLTRPAMLRKILEHRIVHEGLISSGEGR